MNNEYTQSLSIACSHLKKRLPRSAQNLGILMDTFELVSDQSRLFSPLAQTCLEAPDFIHHSGFPSTTEDISKFLTTFLDSSRSALVYSLMEPFFTGDLVLKKNRFISAYMIANGAAHWYIDTVLTPDIRGLLPNGEILFRHLKFHPYRALDGSFENDGQALDFYIQFFSSNSASNQSRSLNSAFENEYSSLRTLRRQEASRIQFSEFRRLFNSFYEFPNLPTLTQCHFSSTSFEKWVIEFVSFLKTKQLKLRQSDRLRIKLRRSLQSRALLYNELLLCMESPLLILTKPELRVSLFDQLDTWGTKLQEMIFMISSKISSRVIEDKLQEADIFYENEMRRLFKKLHVVLGDRPKNDKQIDNLISTMLNRIDLNFSNNPQELEDIFMLIRNFQKGKINRSTFLHSPPIVKFWGTELASVSPLQRTYRDLVLW